MNYASLISDMLVTIGMEECLVTFLATNQLSCRPPVRQPRVEDSGYGPGNAPRVTVYVGSLSYVIGYLAYTNRTEKAAQPLSEAILGAIVAVAVGLWFVAPAEEGGIMEMKGDREMKYWRAFGAQK